MLRNPPRPTSGIDVLKVLLRGSAVVVLALATAAALAHGVFLLRASHTVGHVKATGTSMSQLIVEPSRRGMGAAGGGARRSVPVSVRTTTVAFGPENRYAWDFTSPLLPLKRGSPVAIAWDPAMKHAPQLDGFAGWVGALVGLAIALLLEWLAQGVPRWAGRAALTDGREDVHVHARTHGRMPTGHHHRRRSG